MPILSVHHLTRYRYRRPVGFGEHRVMFRPRESYDLRVLESRLVITPEPVSLRYVHDVFGNCVGIATFSGTASELTFESEIRLEHTPEPLLDADEIDAAFPFSYSAEDLPDLARSIERRHPDPERVLERWAQQFLSRSGPTGVLAALSSMTRTIHKTFSYATRLEGGAHPPLQTLRTREGSCRDFAMLMIEAARSLGLAARFVSGYIYCPPRDGADSRVVGPKGGGHTHAWVQVYVPSCGWVEFDPTNGIIGAQDLIRVAVVRDPAQASPLWGSFEGEACDYLGMDVEVDVGVVDGQSGGRRVA